MGVGLLVSLAVLQFGTGIAKIQEGKELEKQAKIQGEIKAKEREKRAKKLLGKQTMSFLKSGVGLSGTPQIVFDETVDFAKEDISNIRQHYKNVGKRAKREATFEGLSNIAMAGITAFSAFQPAPLKLSSKAPVKAGFDPKFNIDIEGLKSFENIGNIDNIGNIGNLDNINNFGGF